MSSSWAVKSIARVTTRPLAGRFAGLAPLAALVALATIHLLTLLRMPAPFVDEPWYASRAWSIVQSGPNFSSLDSGVFDRFDGYWTYFPWLGTWLQSLAVRAFGLDLFSVRLTSLLFGFALLGAIYTIANRLYGRREALLAVALVALSHAFLLSAHMARQDVMVAALGFAAVALYLNDRGSGVSSQAFLSGLAVGLAFEIHPNAVLYGPALVALYLFDHGLAVVRLKRFWAFGVGLGAGLAFYAALHVLPYPDTYAALTRLAAGEGRTPPLFVLDPGAWIESLVDLGQLFLTYFNIAIPIIAEAVALLWLSRSRADRRLLVLVLALALGYLTLVRFHQLYYQILVSPVVDILLATYILRIPWARWNASLRPLIRTALVVGLLLGLVVRFLSFPVRNDPMNDYRTTLAAISQAVPDGSSAMGAQTFWFALPDQRYLSWEQLVFYQRYAPGSSLEDGFAALQPDFLILDDQIRKFVAEDKTKLPPYNQLLFLPRGELQRVLNERGALIATVETESYGNVLIYKMNWQ